jgi:O-antigen ligase
VPEDVPRPLPEGWYGHLHNIYLQYAAERGIPTMLCMMWFLIKILTDSARALRRKPGSEHRYFHHATIAATIAIMVSGLFEMNLGDTEVLTLYLAIVACNYTLISEPDVEPAAGLPLRQS